MNSGQHINRSRQPGQKSNRSVESGKEGFQAIDEPGTNPF